MQEASDPGRAVVSGPESLEAALAGERARAREIDHRAKNSLQLVASLLLLLSRRSVEPETRQALAAMHQRMGAVGAVHRNLLEAARPDRFDLTRLVQEHAASLALACGARDALSLELEPVEVAPSAAAPLALILNELALNALQHAGRDGRPPTLTVRLACQGTGLVLTVEDDGPGPAAVKEPRFGLMIVQLLARQLSADFAMEDAQPGLRAVVTVA
jgi:two-component sensor histidine kinase